MEILKKHGYEDYYDKSKIIMDNLDKAIDFIPPLFPTDGLTKYARELERLLLCQEGVYFITGKTQIFRTKYSEYKNGKWNKN